MPGLLLANSTVFERSLVLLLSKWDVNFAVIVDLVFD